MITPYLVFHGRCKEALDFYRAVFHCGEVTIPPTETFCSVFHAAVTDRFGMSWDVVAEEPPRGLSLS